MSESGAVGDEGEEEMSVHDVVAADASDGRGSLPTPPDRTDLRALERLRPLVEAARGLAFGEDWNKGTAAKTHGYRDKLLRALPDACAVFGLEAPPTGSTALLRRASERDVAFRDWIVRAYNFGSWSAHIFTAWNMEVAFRAGAEWQSALGDGGAAATADADQGTQP